jgi:hypothetical protein
MNATQTQLSLSGTTEETFLVTFKWFDAASGAGGQFVDVYKAFSAKGAIWCAEQDKPNREIVGVIRVGRAQ